MLIDYFKLGLSNLRQRGLRSWLTMIGIFIGIAAVVSLLSLGQGMKSAIGSQFASLGAETITIQAAGGGFGPPGSYISVPITKDDLKVVKQTAGVDNAFGRLIESVSVEVNGVLDNSYVVSITNDPKEYDMAISIPTEFSVESGRLVNTKDCSKIVIGNNIAHKEVFSKKLSVGDKIKIKDMSVDVVGILEKTGNPQFDKSILMPEDCVRKIIDDKEKYALIVSKVETNKDVDEVVSAISKNLRKERNVKLGKEDFSVESSQEVLEKLNSILGVVQAVLIGIAAISLLVGGVGITNTMYTAVLERTKEIGIMKAIGARNSDISIIFLIESGLLGMVGGIIGIGIGVGLGYAVEVIAFQTFGKSLIEAEFSIYLIIGSLLFSFLVGSLSGIFPARNAAKMKPVEALQNG